MSGGSVGRGLDRRLSGVGSAGMLGAGLGAVLALGVVDLWMGSEISFSIFYVLPISAVTWYAGLGRGGVVALISAATWLFADLGGGHVYSDPLIPWWNSLVRLGYFLIIARLLSSVRERLAFEESLAASDFLTDLPNARAFVEALESERVRCGRYGRPFTLVYMDLDDFKRVNDTLGHDAGDRLLGDFGRALRSAVRRTDVVGRLGGDEFAALLPETDAAAAGPVLAKIREVVAETIGHGGWPAGTSLGAITFDAPPVSAAAALKAADALMYEAKRSGKNQVVHRRSGGAPTEAGQG